jgi:extracellular elastinolytic metalloproteinase
MFILHFQFEVEMEDNWYETVVTMQHPHRILSVVDWASDAPIPNEPHGRTEATYKVFEWGINDPSEGPRTFQKESSDKLASPWGWHSLPVANDPLVSEAERRGMTPGARSNYTTTVGNNVCYVVI